MSWATLVNTSNIHAFCCTAAPKGNDTELLAIIQHYKLLEIQKHLQFLNPRLLSNTNQGCIQK